MALFSYTYLTPHFIVMEIHESPGILFYLPCIHKHLGKAQAIADISWAAAPLPALFLVVETLLLFIAPAATQGSLGAGGSDSMGNPSSNDCIGESCLFTPCKKRENLQIRITANKICCLRPDQVCAHASHSWAFNSNMHKFCQVLFIYHSVFALLPHLTRWVLWTTIRLAENRLIWRWYGACAYAS